MKKKTKKLNTLTSKKPLEVTWIKEAKEQSNSEGAVRWIEGLQEEGGEEAVEGRAWETSTNSRLVTLKMLLASTLLVIACVCACVFEFMRVKQDVHGPTD